MGSDPLCCEGFLPPSTCPLGQIPKSPTRESFPPIFDGGGEEPHETPPSTPVSHHSHQQSTQKSHSNSIKAFHYTKTYRC